MQKILLFSCFLCLGFAACRSNSKLPQLSDEEPFVKYWFTGNAELNSYELDQAQYGAMHKGNVMLIFVTEDFKLDKQVKAQSDASKQKITTVMKMNAIRRFTTGIYDYSAMTSVFMPVAVNDFPNALKVSTSVQDWCGHSYLQMNFRQNGYQITGNSYFEDEALVNYHVDKGTAEDELFSAIRLRPNRLEIGDKMMLPTLLSARLRHSKIVPILADLKLYDYKERYYSGEKLKVYEVDYRGDARNVKIIFENIFPYRIVGFEETYKQKDVFMTSRAKLKRCLQTPYWLENTPADSLKRMELGL